MKIRNNYKNLSLGRRFISVMALTAFLFTSILPAARAQEIFMPPPGAMVGTSAGYVPISIKGLKLFADNPFRFDFILDTGHSKLQGEPLKKESQILIKYFLTALTVPDDDQWVNLSPFEKNRIIPQAFGTTEMGRVLLAQDYLLKQLSATLTKPDTELGKKYWEKAGTVPALKGTVPAFSLNKVWIMPDHAKVYESGPVAFITESHLKVMMEEDYSKSLTPPNPLFKKEGGRGSSEIFRSLILPRIEKEINEGENFAPLRQVYHAMIMAAWYKRKLKDGILGKIYVGANKVAGVDTLDKNIKQKIYDQYIEAFKKGVYNFIKEEEDGTTEEMVPRKYFSGGVMGGEAVLRSTDFEIAATSEQLNQSVSSSTTGKLITAQAGLQSIQAASTSTKELLTDQFPNRPQDDTIFAKLGERTSDLLSKRYKINPQLWALYLESNFGQYYPIPQIFAFHEEYDLEFYVGLVMWVRYVDQGRIIGDNFKEIINNTIRKVLMKHIVLPDKLRESGELDYFRIILMLLDNRAEDSVLIESFKQKADSNNNFYLKLTEAQKIIDQLTNNEPIAMENFKTGDLGNLINEADKQDSEKTRRVLVILSHIPGIQDMVSRIPLPPYLENNPVERLVLFAILASELSITPDYQVILDTFVPEEYYSSLVGPSHDFSGSLDSAPYYIMYSLISDTLHGGKPFVLMTQRIREELGEDAFRMAMYLDSQSVGRIITYLVKDPQLWEKAKNLVGLENLRETFAMGPVILLKFIELLKNNHFVDKVIDSIGPDNIPELFVAIPFYKNPLNFVESLALIQTEMDFDRLIVIRDVLGSDFIFRMFEANDDNAFSFFQSIIYFSPQEISQNLQMIAREIGVDNLTKALLSDSAGVMGMVVALELPQRVTRLQELKAMPNWADAFIYSPRRFVSLLGTSLDQILAEEPARIETGAQSRGMLQKQFSQWAFYAQFIDQNPALIELFVKWGSQMLDNMALIENLSQNTRDQIKSVVNKPYVYQVLIQYVIDNLGNDNSDAALRMILESPEAFRQLMTRFHNDSGEYQQLIEKSIISLVINKTNDIVSEYSDGISRLFVDLTKLSEKRLTWDQINLEWVKTKIGDAIAQDLSVRESKGGYSGEEELSVSGIQKSLKEFGVEVDEGRIILTLERQNLWWIIDGLILPRLSFLSAFRGGRKSEIMSHFLSLGTTVALKYAHMGGEMSLHMKEGDRGVHEVDLILLINLYRSVSIKVDPSTALAFSSESAIMPFVRKRFISIEAMEDMAVVRRLISFSVIESNAKQEIIRIFGSLRNMEPAQLSAALDEMFRAVTHLQSSAGLDLTYFEHVYSDLLSRKNQLYQMAEADKKEDLIQALNNTEAIQYLIKSNLLEEAYRNYFIKRKALVTRLGAFGQFDVRGAVSSSIIPIASNRGQSAANPDNLGGIDMNQKNLDLQTSGEGIRFDKSFDPAQIQNIKFDGFSPVILRIMPTNLPVLLGQTQHEVEMKVSKS